MSTLKDDGRCAFYREVYPQSGQAGAMRNGVKLSEVKDIPYLDIGVLVRETVTEVRQVIKGKVSMIRQRMIDHSQDAFGK